MSISSNFCRIEKKHINLSIVPHSCLTKKIKNIHIYIRTRQVHFMQGSARQRVRLARIWAKCEYLPPICAYTTKPQQQSEFTRCLSKFHAAKHRLRTLLLLCHSLTLPQLSTHRVLYCHSLNTVTEWIGYIANGFSWYRLYMQHMATSWCLIQTLAQASEKETLKQRVFQYDEKAMHPF